MSARSCAKRVVAVDAQLGREREVVHAREHRVEVVHAAVEQRG